MKKQWDTVEVIRHARHDWLNKLQLIKGNLSLNKVERAKEIIDEAVLEAQNEAKLSNLHIPLFAGLLLTHNWESSSFQVEYEVIDLVKTDKLNDERLHEWTSLFFQKLNETIKCFHDNKLSLTIEPQTKGIRFFFDFSGIITNKDALHSFLTQSNTLSVGIRMEEFTDEELAFEVFMPFE